MKSLKNFQNTFVREKHTFVREKHTFLQDNVKFTVSTYLKQLPKYLHLRIF